MRITLLLLVALPFLALTKIQAIDESLVERPSRAIDFPGCYSDLNQADRNGDGFVKLNEYLFFIQEYGMRICFSTDELSLQQVATFNTLACICRSQEGSSEDCCLGDNARIPTAGTLLPVSQQTPSQRNYLTSVCKLTDATMDGQCPPSMAPTVAGGNEDSPSPIESLTLDDVVVPAKSPDPRGAQGGHTSQGPRRLTRTLCLTCFMMGAVLAWGLS